MSGLPRESEAEARRWLREANEELATADAIAANEELPARAACFHAHLAAEKALKGLVIARGVELRRSHDLAYVLALLPADDAQPFDVDDLAALNPWTIEGRYPAELADTGSAEAKNMTAAARRVVAEVERVLEPPPPQLPGSGD